MTTLHELFVPYNLAMLAKQKGFNEVGLGYYYPDGVLRFASPSQSSKFIPYFYTNESNMWKLLFSFKKTKDESCIAPTHQQLVDWFRTKHNIWISLELGSEYITVWKIGGTPTRGHTEDYYKSYNKALEEAFKLI